MSDDGNNINLFHATSYWNWLFILFHGCLIVWFKFNSVSQLEAEGPNLYLLITKRIIKVFRMEIIEEVLPEAVHLLFHKDSVFVFKIFLPILLDGSLKIYNFISVIDSIY